MSYTVAASGNTAISSGCPPLLGRISSSIYLGPPTRALTTQSYAFENFLWTVPIFVQRGGAITKIGIAVTSAAVGGSVARLGLYHNDPTRNLPGVRVVDASTVAIDSTGDKEATVSVTLQDSTWYWGVVVHSGLPVLRACSDMGGVLGQVVTSSSSCMPYRAFTLGALPADESAQNYTLTNSTLPPFIWVRG
jgi:hypothetical protein